jgi:1-Cys peroxiredoxin 6
VCTTELGHLTKIYGEFEKRNTKVIALSCNPVESHIEWEKDIQVIAGTEGGAFPYVTRSSPHSTQCLIVSERHFLL